MFERFEKLLIDTLENSDVVDFTRDNNIFVTGRINNGSKSYGTIQITCNPSINNYKLKIRPFTDVVRQRSMDVTVIDDSFDVAKVEKWIQKFIRDAENKIAEKSESKRKEYEANNNLAILMNYLLQPYDSVSYDRKRDCIGYDGNYLNYSLVNEVVYVKLSIGESTSFTKHIMLDDALPLIDTLFGES